MDTPWERAYANVERHCMRQRENVILRRRFFPSWGHYFDVAENIREIRLRDAETALAAIKN